MATMRAKLKVTAVRIADGTDPDSRYEEVEFMAVGPDTSYPEDGSDEDNTFARFTPQADMKMVIANPALFGKIKQGQKFYADFTPVEHVEAGG